jgi:hypothetical protein
MYKLQEHVPTHTYRGEILIHIVGAQWYTQQFNIMLSLCRMPDSVAIHLR